MTQNLHARLDGPAGAPAVVLIHGFAGSLHWYDRVTPLLANTFEVLRVDLRGHGRTGGHHDLDAPAQARSVVAAMASAEIDGALVVGHSFGCDVALHAAAASDRAAQVMLLDQAPDYRGAHFPPGSTLMAAPGAAAVSRRVSHPRLVRRFARHGFAPGYDLRTGFDDPEQVVRDVAAISPGMYRVVLTTRRRRLERRPLDSLVADLDKPVTVLHGRADQFYDWRPTLDRYAAVGAETHLVEDCGHSPNVEQPGQVADAIRSCTGTATS